MGTIPSTDITIDGDTAWLVVRNQDGWFWETDHNRPCDLCVRYAAVGPASYVPRLSRHRATHVHARRGVSARPPLEDGQPTLAQPLS